MRAVCRLKAITRTPYDVLHYFIRDDVGKSQQALSLLPRIEGITRVEPNSTLC